MIKAEFVAELTENILPFWSEKLFDANGGFYGQISGLNVLNKSSSRGIVMHARILWTFATSYERMKNPSYLTIANHAYNYIVDKFIDKEFGGVYWEVDNNGVPLQDKKQIYAQAFTLYAFSALYKVTSDTQLLDRCLELFDLLEKHKDHVFGGYFEAFSREWSPIADMRLSAKDQNDAKSMNTHLHVLEAYSGFLSIYNKNEVRKVQKELLSIFLNKIYNKTGHFTLFFEANWENKSENISYGHDIEAAWLIWEAANLVKDEFILEKVRAIILDIGEHVKNGLLQDGSLAYEMKNDVLDTERHWWVQAEAVVGYSYLAKIFNNPEFDLISVNCWKYIKKEIIDQVNGEWYWSRLENGEVNFDEDKAGFWKCPYHNGRMCLEMMELLAG